MNKKELYVENLKCNGCANSIKKGLSFFEEVTNVEVDVDNAAVTVSYEGEEGLIELYIEKLSSMGYPQSDQNTIFKRAQSYISCMIGRLDNDVKFNLDSSDNTEDKNKD